MNFPNLVIYMEYCHKLGESMTVLEALLGSGF